MEKELICRTCLSSTSKCLSIYSMPTYCGKTFTLSKMIMACAPVEISEGDGLPSKICENCLKHLQISFLFRIRVLQANEKLKEYFQTKLFPNTQSISQGFIEPLPIPSDDDLKHLFSWDQVFQPDENEMDPLFVDPFIEQTEFKTEVKQEILPIEEVMLPSNTDDYESYKTGEITITMPPTTEYSNDKTNEPVFVIPVATASETLTPVTNTELSQVSWPNNTTNMQLFNNNTQNTDCNTNALQIHLSENDTTLIQSILQNIQSGQINPNSRYIIVKANQTNLLNNDNQTESSQSLLKSILSDQNTLSKPSQSTIQNNTFNKSPSVQNTTLKTSYGLSNKVCPDKQEKKTFEGELQKFVQERQKLLQCRQEPSILNHQVSYTPNGFVNEKKKKSESPSLIKNKKKKSEPPSIDLTSDDDTPDTPLSKTPTNIANNLVRSQNNLNSSNALPFLNNLTVHKGGNRFVRLTIEEDQSSAIIIDD